MLAMFNANQRPAKPTTETPFPLKSLPPELIIAVFHCIPREADRQSLRYACKSFRDLLPPAILCIQPKPCPCSYSFRSRKKPEYPHWAGGSSEQYSFLSRLYWDMPPSSRKDKMVCLYCRRIKKRVEYYLTTRVPKARPPGGISVDMVNWRESIMCAECGELQTNMTGGLTTYVREGFGGWCLRWAISRMAKAPKDGKCGCGVFALMKRRPRIWEDNKGDCARCGLQLV